MLKLGWGTKFKHRKFEYVPRYYDADKEEFNERIRMLEEKYGEKGDLDVERMKYRIKKGLRMKSSVDPNTRKIAEQAASKKRLLIVFILVLVFVFILQSEKIEQFLKIFYK